MKVKDLRPSKQNPRTITDRKLNLLGKSMRKFGDLSGIIFNRRTGNLIGGHQRIKHLKTEWEIIKKPTKDGLGTLALGFIKTPFGNWLYREVDWPEDKEKMANIAANRHGGEFNFSAVADILSKLGNSRDLELTGFSSSDLQGQSEQLHEALIHEELDLRPYKMTHVLLSFPPEKLASIQKHLDAILKIEGVEYEQSSN